MKNEETEKKRSEQPEEKILMSDKCMKYWKIRLDRFIRASFGVLYSIKMLFDFSYNVFGNIHVEF